MRYLLAVLAMAFVVASSVLTFTNRSSAPMRLARFDWPDEMATAYFVERIVDGQPIASYDPLIGAAANRIHPRSINVRNSALVPGGFLGFPIILGVMGVWFGYAATFLVTPLLAVAGIYALMFMVRRVFDEPVARLTGVLAFTNPALLYYASYVMLPNVAFVSLALIGAALAMTGRWRFLGGVLVGLALFIRPNETIWVLPVFVAVVRRNPWSPLAGLSLGFAPTFLANLAVFGQLLATGYNRFIESGAVTPLETTGSIIFPFGIHPAMVATNLWHSAFRLFWWIVIPAGVGLILSWKKHRSYSAVALVVAAWLVLYYGSWPFTDVEILAQNTIGRSYVRYWLPAFLLVLPFAAVAIRRLGRYASVAALVAMTFLSVRLVYWSAPESIVPVARRIVRYHEVRDMVEKNTPPDAVVITSRTDKMVFPERRVAETDLSMGLDAVIASEILHTDKPTWYIFAKITDLERQAIETDLPGSSLDRINGFSDDGPVLYAID